MPHSTIRNELNMSFKFDIDSILHKVLDVMNNNLEDISIEDDCITLGDIKIYCTISYFALRIFKKTGYPSGIRPVIYHGDMSTDSSHIVSLYINVIGNKIEMDRHKVTKEFTETLRKTIHDMESALVNYMDKISE